MSAKKRKYYFGMFCKIKKKTFILFTSLSSLKKNNKDITWINKNTYNNI